ncbi:hypothetical protein HGA92_04035 [Candidatus Gracilibacteria bacterium]|nr:hypothetical protein [Candidatus Gracilibacteria bacterium]NUJ99268.1 hypothetical protein [Candidatus Gracilibacteria bacterium]
MDNKQEKTKRFLQSKLAYFLLIFIFLAFFYASFFIFGNKELNIQNFQMHDIFEKYGIYFPLVFGIVALVGTLLLFLIKIIFRLNLLVVSIIIYLLVYGFLLAFGIQLKYFEPRYTDIAIALIDNYALPLIIASSASIIFTFIFSFFKKK